MRAALRWTIWVAVMLLAGEAAVRAAALVLRRDAPTVQAAKRGDVIYCLGDSFTYGQGVATEDAWPQVLARLLQTAMPTGAPRVRPLAEPGRSSSVVVVDLANVLKAGDARLVLILTGWNANDGDFAAHAKAQSQEVPWAATLDVWLEHSRLYRVLKQALTFRSRTLVFDDVRIIPQTTAMSLYTFRAYQEIALENLRQIARMCHAADVPCAFLTYPHQLLPASASTRTEYYHAIFGRTPLAESDYLLHDRRPGEIAIDAIIRSVAERESIPLIDLQPAFEHPEGRDLYQRDYHHPTAAGHDLIAHTVFDALRAGLVPDAASPATVGAADDPDAAQAAASSSDRRIGVSLSGYLPRTSR
jgi:lysophospholipase L1-like esterase